ncbi:cell division protein FtsL [Bacillota bacterium LX-D]|nr:cell division protein FtsL [Bacillota bacterium LX-D]
MLVVPEKNHYDYKPIVNVPKARKSKRIPAAAKVLIIVLVLASFVVGLFLASRVALFTQKGHQIIKLKKEIKSLQTANERLKLEIDQIGSLEHVEKVAVNKLGMIEPEFGDVEILPTDGNLHITEEAGEPKKSNQQKKAPQNNIAKIYSKISSIFTRSVEASEL